MKFRNFFLPALFALALLVVGCSDDDDSNPTPPQSPATSSFGPEVAKEWMDLSYSMVKSASYSPPVASRIYGYLGVTLYEAVVPGASGFTSLAGQLDALSTIPQPTANVVYDWPTVANNALATVATTMFATAHDTVKAHITEKKDSWNAARQSAVSAEVYDRSLLQGEAVAAAIIVWASTDGYTEHTGANCVYTPPSFEGAWVPTPPAYSTTPLLPCWGELRTFVLDRGGSTLQCDPATPPAYSTEPTSAYYLEAQEVYDVKANLTADQMAIANFWADGPGATGTPPGHWVVLAGQLTVEQNMKLDRAAEAYVKVGIAAHDAFISCWKAKYSMYGMRPVTFIRAHIAPDTTWNSYIPTPNFPTCTSGHSTSSGACSRVLEAVFGTAVAFTDHTHDSRGLPARSFTSLEQAANEAAVSRLYGGIHYRSDNDFGLTEGRCIGDQINALVFHLDYPL